MESEVFLVHGANRVFPLKQSFEVGPDVDGAVSVSVQRDHVVLHRLNRGFDGA